MRMPGGRKKTTDGTYYQATFEADVPRQVRHLHKLWHRSKIKSMDSHLFDPAYIVHVTAIAIQ